jgi:hypothetical protein
MSTTVLNDAGLTAILGQRHPAPPDPVAAMEQAVRAIGAVHLELSSALHQAKASRLPAELIGAKVAAARRECARLVAVLDAAA